MSLTLGARMIRLDDGTRGTVALVEGERRVVYYDRGEERVAPKKEVWQEERSGERLPLRSEEILEIAHEADRALRAIELHEPKRWWEPKGPTYDQGLVEAVVAYLRSRQ